MGFVVEALFILSLSFGAVLTANDPMPPKITETFSSWTFGLFLDGDGNVIVIEDGGYMARDVVGNRALYAGSVTTFMRSYSYSNLFLFDKNLTYNTYWDEDGNRTCYIYKLYGPGLMPMWDWIQNATYFGNDFGADVWANFDYIINGTIIISVPSNNPVMPLDIEIDHYYPGEGYRYNIFSGFDPNYQPVDDDFIVPADCQPGGKGDPPPIHFPLPHSLHSFRSKKKIHHHMKMNHMKPLHEYKKIPNMLRKRMKKLRK